MLQYKKAINTLLWIKSEPNEHEIHLFERGQKYIEKLSKIPWIEMIAIVNSLSMYATHPDSDIDLFIVTKPWMIWFVRFFSTLILWKHGVWRKGEDIAGNLCISFFITTEALNLSNISIENDIYLYYWIYYMKPVFVQNNTYEKFIGANNSMEIDENQKIENKKFLLLWRISEGFVMRIFRICRAIFSVKLQRFWILQFRKKSSDTDAKIQHRSQKTFGTFSHKSTGNDFWLKKIYKHINQIIRFFFLRKTLRSKEKLWSPEWIIISDTILKFHNQDRRKEIRDTILKNNFDK